MAVMPAPFGPLVLTTPALVVMLPVVFVETGRPSRLKRAHPGHSWRPSRRLKADTQSVLGYVRLRPKADF
jgi:hypothetical protein